MADGKLPEFEYERQAMAGEEMPDGLRFAGQHYYLGLRMLYHQYKQGIIDRETAKREKRQLYNTYEYDIMWEEIAIKNYQNAIDKVENESLKKLLSEIQDDEKDHLKLLKDQLARF